MITPSVDFLGWMIVATFCVSHPGGHVQGIAAHEFVDVISGLTAEPQSSQVGICLKLPRLCERFLAPEVVHFFPGNGCAMLLKSSHRPWQLLTAA